MTLGGRSQGACTNHGTLRCGVVQTREPIPLTDPQEGHVVVFTGHGKSSGAGHCVIFSPLQGSEAHMDLDQAWGWVAGGGRSVFFSKLAVWNSSMIRPHAMPSKII